MKEISILFIFTLFVTLSCTTKNNLVPSMEATSTDNKDFKCGYAAVNGLSMYYEIYGNRGSKPLVLVHGGGSTIQTNFEKIIPLLAKSRKIIAVELQAHGRTNDRNADSSFEQDADDIAALLKTLSVEKADFLGFSNGGTTALQMAIRHPHLVNKLILCSTLAKRNGVSAGFWEFMKQASLESMPVQLKEGYLKVATHVDGLQTMHDRDAKRMLNFKDIPDDELQGISVPALIINGDKDVILPEHALALHRLLSQSSLAILPGGHGDYLGEVTSLKATFKESDLAIPIIENFLDKKEAE